MKFAQHSRVRLSATAARMAMRGYSPFRRGHRHDWAKREGTVISVGFYNGSVAVLWDGRKSYDYWPMRALEEITT